MDTKKLRQKILDLAIHGKLVPQDPNDEPASVLLERIRAEKERLVKEGKIKKSKTSKTSDTPHYEQVPFEVPDSWEWTTISLFTYDLQYGTSEKSSNKGSVPVLRMGNITRDGSIDYSDLVYSSNKEDIRKFNLQKNDLLFNRTNSSEWVGKTAIFKLDTPTIYAGYLIRVRCILINSDYLNFVMNSSYHRTWCNQAKTDAVNQSNINAQKLSNLQIPIPPIAEQHRIVEEIERWFTLIDQIEQGKADLQTTIKQAKSKILDLAIHGKLVPQDPNEEPASELLKRINPKAEITCDNGQYGKVTFEIPYNWCWQRLGDINDIARGGSPRPIKDYLTDDEDGVNWIKIGDTSKDEKYINSVKEKIRVEGVKKSRMVHKGDFLLTNSMSFGRPYILNVDGCIHDGWLVISPKGNAYNADFLYYLLSSTFAYDQFAEVASGGVVTNLNSDKVADTMFPLPPLPEQYRIVAKIEELFTSLDNIQKALEV